MSLSVKFVRGIDERDQDIYVQQRGFHTGVSRAHSSSFIHRPLLIVVEQTIHEIDCDYWSIRAARQQRNAVAVFQLEIFGLQRFAQEARNHTSGSCLPLLRDLLYREQ
jgi:hypothetical protein